MATSQNCLPARREEDAKAREVRSAARALSRCVRVGRKLTVFVEDDGHVFRQREYDVVHGDGELPSPSLAERPAPRLDVVDRLKRPKKLPVIDSHQLVDLLNYKP